MNDTIDASGDISPVLPRLTPASQGGKSGAVVLRRSGALINVQQLVWEK
jgi:hypothetical protein